MSTQEYNVTGMTCGHCEASVREEVSEINGVSNIQVSASNNSLSFEADQPIDDATVLAAVEEAGYTATRK